MNNNVIMNKNVSKDKHNNERAEGNLAPFESKDLLNYKLITEIHISNTSNEILYELEKNVENDDTTITNLWIADVKGSNPIQLTFGSHTDKSPRWSPDGNSIAFSSTREGDEKPQIYLISRNGGEARRISNIKGGITSFEWAPCGTKFFAISSVETSKKPEDISDVIWQNKPKEICSQRYKSNGMGFLLDKRSHIFEISLDTGDAESLTSGDYDVTNIKVSLSGNKIAYCRSREGKYESHLSDLWIMDVKNKSHEQLTTNIVSASNPAISPDEKWVSVVGATEAGRSILWPWIVELESKQIFELGDGQAEIATFPLATPVASEWSKDSKSLYFLRSSRGICEIANVDVETKKMKIILTGERHVYQLRVAKNYMAFVSISISDAGDIHLADLDGANERTLTDVNGDWWMSKDLPKWQRVEFEIEKDRTIEGWLLESGKANGPAPLLVDVHGGPHSMVEFGFPYHVYWYLLISRGWRILTLNQEGSGSYGLEYAEKLRGHWGELDFPQIVKAVKSLQEQGKADDRLAIAGKSYGGFMSAWAVGHSNMFKAAVVSAPVSNLESHAGTSDSGFYVAPFDVNNDLNHHREEYRRLSPVAYCDQVKTPTLVLQGEEDERCPKGQSEEFFEGIMQNKDVPAEMVLYPGGIHSLAESGKPSHRLHYHQKVVDWVEKWVTE
jgi:dipeptidyl aminopeptidase/acylaminoacyl peptidase